ncbi:hypothetical protein N7517_005854 [Penicillium concentricum]|uniref:Uncharacterized protein n=1 Tax=Penicillium concentricum TaxID=293559 RepID=A0A9W9S8D7_9EURO|nr:uncharacterized protein N7517_005854 [Penicillium concentricum]KAJ5373848.1 hypothetical protein N7517_005854 [Penicillium concentricum]
MESTGEESQFLGVPGEVAQILRRSDRIAAQIAAQKARESETEASSACEPSKSDSHKDLVLKHDCFACGETICDSCRVAFGGCVEMIDKYNASVDAAMKLTGKKFREEIRMILRENKEWIRGLKSQQNREG